MSIAWEFGELAGRPVDDPQLPPDGNAVAYLFTHGEEIALYVSNAPLVTILDDLGADGWELVLELPHDHVLPVGVTDEPDQNDHDWILRRRLTQA